MEPRIVFAYCQVTRLVFLIFLNIVELDVKLQHKQNRIEWAQKKKENNLEVLQDFFFFFKILQKKC